MDTRGETLNAGSSSTSIIMEEKEKGFEESLELNNQTSVQVQPSETPTPDSSCRDANSDLGVPPAVVPVHQVPVRTLPTRPSVILTPSLPPSNQSTNGTRTAFRPSRQTGSPPPTGMRTTGSFLTGFIVSGVVLIITSISMFTSENSHQNGILTLNGDKIYQSTNYYRVLAPVFLTLGITLVIAGMALSFRFCGYFRRERGGSEEECHENFGFSHYTRRPRVASNSGRYPTQDLFGQIPYNHTNQTRDAPPPPSYWEAPPPYSEAVNSPGRY